MTYGQGTHWAASGAVSECFMSTGSGNSSLGCTAGSAGCSQEPPGRAQARGRPWCRRRATGGSAAGGRAGVRAALWPCLPPSPVQSLRATHTWPQRCRGTAPGGTGWPGPQHRPVLCAGPPLPLPPPGPPAQVMLPRTFISASLTSPQGRCAQANASPGPSLQPHLQAERTPWSQFLSVRGLPWGTQVVGGGVRTAAPTPTSRPQMS